MTREIHDQLNFYWEETQKRCRVKTLLHDQEVIVMGERTTPASYSEQM